EIIGTDDADLEARKPARAFQTNAGRSVVEGIRFGVPTRAMTGANEDGVTRLDHFLADLLALETGLQVSELDFLTDIEHTSLEALHIKQNASGEERRCVFHTELLQPVG